MEYSAATASLSIGGAVLLLPHFSIGLACLLFALCGRVIIRGAESKLGLLIQVPVGLLFFGFATWTVVNDTVQTYRCRAGVANGEFESVSGPISIVERFAKPGYGYVEFTVGERAFKTYESGSSCDCGYILPLGRTLRLQDGMVVEAKVQGAKVLALKVKNAG